MNRGLKLLYTYILKLGWHPVEYKEDHLGGYVTLKLKASKLYGAQRGYLSRIYLWKTNK